MIGVIDIPVAALFVPSAARYPRVTTTEIRRGFRGGIESAPWFEELGTYGDADPKIGFAASIGRGYRPKSRYNIHTMLARDILGGIIRVTKGRFFTIEVAMIKKCYVRQCSLRTRATAISRYLHTAFAVSRPPEHLSREERIATSTARIRWKRLTNKSSRKEGGQNAQASVLRLRRHVRLPRQR